MIMLIFIRFSFFFIYIYIYVLLKLHRLIIVYMSASPRTEKNLVHEPFWFLLFPSLPIFHQPYTGCSCLCVFSFTSSNKSRVPLVLSVWLLGILTVDFTLCYLLSSSPTNTSTQYLYCHSACYNLLHLSARVKCPRVFFM